MPRENYNFSVFLPRSPLLQIGHFCWLNKLCLYIKQKPFMCMIVSLGASGAGWLLNRIQRALCGSRGRNKTRVVKWRFHLPRPVHLASLPSFYFFPIAELFSCMRCSTAKKIHNSHELIFHEELNLCVNAIKDAAHKNMRKSAKGFIISAGDKKSAKGASKAKRMIILQIHKRLANDKRNPTSKFRGVLLFLFSQRAVICLHSIFYYRWYTHSTECSPGYLIYRASLN